MHNLEQHTVLCLNSGWQAISTCSPKKAIAKLTRKKASYLAFNIEWEQDKTSLIDVICWDEWIKLPLREADRAIRCSHSSIRMPTVIITKHFDKVPLVEPGFSKQAIWERDDYTCQLTQQKVSKKTGNIDHLISRKNGGQSTFQNCLVILKALNTLKGNLNMQEFCKKYGYKMPQTPKAPKHYCKIRNSYDIRDWNIFLNY